MAGPADVLIPIRHDVDLLAEISLNPYYCPTD